MTRVSAAQATCRHINYFYTATVDRMIVVIVGSCLRFKVNWSVMFVFTLTQSRTHVDTVQSVINIITSSNDICWSHTMKVLGSRVTFVRRNSAAVVTWSCQAVGPRPMFLLWMSKAFLYSSWIETASSSTFRIQTVFLSFMWPTVYKRKCVVKKHFKKCSVEHGVTVDFSSFSCL